MGCEAKDELTKKGVKKEFFNSEIKVSSQDFGQERVTYIIYQI